MNCNLKATIEEKKKSYHNKREESLEEARKSKIKKIK